MTAKDLVSYKIYKRGLATVGYGNFNLIKGYYSIKLTKSWFRTDRYIIEVMREFDKSLSWKTV